MGLREIAEAAATPGPWRVCCSEKEPDGEGVGPHVVADREPVGGYDVPESLGDARFIATFDPPTVLALLDVVEAAEKVERSKRPCIRGGPYATEVNRPDLQRLGSRLARLREVSDAG